MKNLPILAFFAAAVLNLYGNVTENSTLIYVSKPLLMPLLAVWMLVSTDGRNAYSFFRKAVLGALVFSTFGDVLLMFPGALFFLLGLAAFLLAHVFYIGAFSSIAGFKNGFLNQNPGWILPFGAFPVCLLIYLWEGIPVGMKVPVAGYASVISIMALCVVNLKGKIANNSFWTLMAGAGLFLISDSALAIAKFGQAFEGERLLIMGTYILGQYLLVRGGVEVMGTGLISKS